MTKRLLVSSVCLAMATSLIVAPVFAQTPAAAPAAPAPATPAPAAPVPAAPAPAAPASDTSAPTGSSAAAPAAGATTHAGRHAGMRRGQRVENLQTALNANGAQITVDGKMGPKTSAALMDFQKAHGLKATGHVDKETMAALKKPS
jgi:peptidoglycan hydrolase-like protein with peptidoglycan-binding domain